MKIINLKIKEYKNLKNLDLSFEKTTSNINYIIGRNGSGKSNLIEAITLIFKCTVLNINPSFSYEMTYEIKNNGDRKRVVLKGEKDKKLEYPAGYESKSFLPHSVVTYYAGIDNKYKKLISEIESKFIGDLKQAQFEPRILFNLEFRHFNSILISLLAAPNLDDKYILESSRKTLTSKCNIKEIEKIEFEIEEIPNLKGDPKTFFKAFFDCALEVKKEKDMTIIIYDQKTLFTFRELVGVERDVLKVLDILYFANVIKNTVVTLKMSYSLGEKTDAIPKPIDSLSLSEGERQFITMLGISEFFGYKETLYLLDEPDTFLHPGWQFEFDSQLTELNSKQHFIVVTHSPALISRVKKENVFLIDKGKMIDTRHTFGRDFSSILEDVMGVEDRNPITAPMFDKFYELLEKENFTEAEEILKQLTEYMGSEDKQVFRARSILEYERD